ncbi:hypothetical protein WBJ53_05670 [Spirosoma sp. SC4-14]|uniref:hypothetical protein n=1 Tax=Spirosoma sp. SC4-14 TaxID=3128900 RepID=UPI0030CAB41A
MNWLTVWGIVIACIVFNRYTDRRQQKQHERAQYEAISQRADSLLVEKQRLEQRLQQLESTTKLRISVIQRAQPARLGEL